MPFSAPLISLSLISPRDASNKRSNGPTAPCTTSRAWSQRCGSKSPPMLISATSTRHAPNSVESLPSTPSRPSPPFASTLTLWHRKFSNSTSTACAWLAYRRSEPPCSFDPEGLLRVELIGSAVRGGKVGNRRDLAIQPGLGEGPLTTHSCPTARALSVRLHPL